MAGTQKLTGKDRKGRNSSNDEGDFCQESVDHDLSVRNHARLFQPALFAKFSQKTDWFQFPYMGGLPPIW